MNWIKRNFTRIVVVLINSILIPQLILRAYEIPLTDPLGYLSGTLKVAIPAALISIGLIGMIRDFRVSHLLIALIGGLLLWQNYSFDWEILLDEIRLINDKLAASRPLILSDFVYLLDSITLLITVVCFATLYIYPWNILITDLTVILFLWSVDNLASKEGNLIPLILLWSFLLVHERMISRDALYADFRQRRILKGQRMFQALVIAGLVGALTVALVRDVPGRYYDSLWIRANNYMMQDDFLSGRYFMDAFSLSRTGYQDTSTALGGDVSINNDTALLLTGDAPAYLRGNTKYRYTGSIWEKNDITYRTANIASSLVTDSYGSAPLRSMTLLPEGLETSSLFVPSYPRSVVLSTREGLSRVFYNVQDQTFTVTDPIEGAYTVTYYDETHVEELAMSRISETVFSSYERYLELPATVTARTRELVAEIIDGLETKEEKALAITTYLRENYTYTLRPGSVPEGWDFVDHFLFEAEEGYCVYYGTALTVMLRIAGIPARYAEGFRVPAETDDNGNRVIRNSDAHAWTEVLTDADSDLWTIWDATGTAREHRDAGEDVGGYNPIPGNGTVPGSTSAPPERPDFEDTQPAAGTTPGGRTPQRPGEAGGRAPILPVVLFILMAAGSILLFKRWRMERILKETTGKELLDYIIRLMQDAGIEIAPAATLTDISRSIEDLTFRKQFRDFARDYYRSSYGGEAPRFTGERRRGLLMTAYRVHRMKTSQSRTFVKKYLL